MQTTQINYADSQFPDRLREIERPPQTLYVAGELPNRPYWVAIVGARKPSDHGKQVAFHFGQVLAAAGVVVVSGLALGTDAAAHQGALEADGATIAVLGSGLGQVAPYSNRQLAQRIVASGKGAVISEYPADTPPAAYRYPERNRIVAGLCQAIVVIEGEERSGTLITADEAHKANRQIYAVPGDIRSPQAITPNNLLRSGKASAVIDPLDVLAALGINPGAPEQTLAPTRQEQQVLVAVQAGHTTTQQLIESSGLSAGQLAETISILELTGRLRNVGGNRWALRQYTKPGTS